jgi:glycosyltransferase involved in cell wall biosynthesis
MKMQQPWHIGVLIPARNEEKLLARCLKSVLAAKAKVEQLASADIVVVADSSTDRTVEIASALLSDDGKVASINAGSVGAARRLAALLALERYKGPLKRCWLANTDADCVVPQDWLLQQVKIADKGFDAIAGTVSVDSYEEHQPWVQSQYEASYSIQADGVHGHIHGANLGVRADWYFRAGGWAKLTTAEDHDLWHRLSLVGARKRSSAEVEVQTSGRRVGRAPSGFADNLASYN